MKSDRPLSLRIALIAAEVMLALLTLLLLVAIWLPIQGFRDWLNAHLFN